MDMAMTPSSAHIMHNTVECFDDSVVKEGYL